MVELREELTRSNIKPTQEATPTFNETKTSGRKKADTLPLIEYLNYENKESVISVIRRFIIANNTNNGLALLTLKLSNLTIPKNSLHI